MKYIIGIDLGTTNTALFYARRDEAGVPSRQFNILQLTERGPQERPTLPSAIYLIQGHETEKNSLNLPWEGTTHYAVGEMALHLGKRIPSRLILSAKSWLAIPYSASRDSILPASADETLVKISPLESIRRLLDHLKRAWNHQFKKHPMEEQSVVMTVPASFDDKARRIVFEAALKTGLRNIVFLEEPQAAFYHSLGAEGCPSFGDGDLILVVDIGGGTTDFSLIRHKGEDSSSGFERVAVSDHLLIGGDNIDRAIAYRLRERLEEKGEALSESEWLSLIQAAKASKEELLMDPGMVEKEIVLFGSSSSLLKGAKKVVVGRGDIEEAHSGFLQMFPWSEAGVSMRPKGIQAFGLPYEAEPNILRHLAKFLLPYIERGERVTHVLFNGGQTKSAAVVDAIEGALSGWFGSPHAVRIPSPDPDLAVAKGALLFGLASVGLKGNLIKGGSPRTFVLEVESAKEGEKLVVVALPSGTERGRPCRIDTPFSLRANQPVVFNLYSLPGVFQGKVGELLPLDPEKFCFQGQLQTVVKARGESELPVQLETQVSEIGILELNAFALKGGQQWSFEFSLKEPMKEGVRGGPAASVSREVITRAKDLLSEAFQEGKLLPGLFGALENAVSLPRDQFPLLLLRTLFDELIHSFEPGKLSDEKIVRFWNCAGFLMRPGFGHPLDKERMQKIWKIILKEGADRFKDKDAELQFWIAMRRVAPGMVKGQQLHLQKALFRRLEMNENKPINPKGRQEQYIVEELIRTLASFELIEIKDKIRLGNILLKTVKSGSVKESYLWSLGRVGARVPLYASVSSQVGKNVAEEWLKEALALPTGTKDWKLLLAQLSRKTAADHLDISSQLREQVKICLSGDTDLIGLIEGGEDASSPLEETLLGDSMPLGLKLVSLES
ncbi:hsp70 family protein [Estrella lausannensis]|uniref:Putative chaperone protein DnaK n=1 Tax=Estrella lausannensis TaxID=483423 RepID=A0A0H5DTI3_9BACT|nr:hsp70 family protein [Estrella lausannensis]CRX39164.1 Putative chaperone protein DnaK [Estrella lausannensis]